MSEYTHLSQRELAEARHELQEEINTIEHQIEMAKTREGPVDPVWLAKARRAIKGRETDLALIADLMNTTTA